MKTLHSPALLIIALLLPANSVHGDGFRLGKDSVKLIRIQPEGIPNSGRLFVNNEAWGGSGHGNQALVECANGDLLSFYAQTPGDVMHGHSTTGWTEFRRSRNGGKTWEEPVVLANSKMMQGRGEVHSALVEQAVTAPDGTVIVFIGRYITFDWRRTTPVFLTSHDHGVTWGEPLPVDAGADITKIGRAHAAAVHGKTIYVLFDSGTHNSTKNGTGHHLYVSGDNGTSFEHRSTLPFPETAWYGTLNVISGNRLIAYVYRSEEEKNILYTISDDDGRTWSEAKTTMLAKGLRNPQLSGELGGWYFLHGRSGQNTEDPRHLVLYSSRDGIAWDNGVFLNKGSTTDGDSYSSNVLIGKNKGAPCSLLVQSSIAYDGRSRVNLHHWIIETESRPP